jgi:hypothetical protein
VIRRALAELGLHVTAEERRFLFSPYLYRRLPLGAVQVLEQAEARAPAWLLSRVFWLAAAPSQPAALRKAA